MNTPLKEPRSRRSGFVQIRRFVLLALAALVINGWEPATTESSRQLSACPPPPPPPEDTVTEPADEAPANPREEIEAGVKQLIKRMEEQSVEHMWSSVRRLEALGTEIIPTLEKHLSSRNDKVRLGCAKALIHLGDLEKRETAVEVLVQTIQKTRDKHVKTAAIRILGEDGDPEEVFGLLKGLLDKETDEPDVLIALAKTLYEIDYDQDALSLLRKLLESRDPEVRKSVALALAEVDNFESGVRNILRELKHEPTLRGRLAASLYHNNQLYEQLEKNLESGDEILPGADPQVIIKKLQQQIAKLETQIEDARSAGNSKSRGKNSVVDEVIELIRKKYVDPDRIDRRELLVEAIKGMARSLDGFSSFFDPEQAKRFLDDISGEYVGIGAQVNKPSTSAPLEIAKPIYGGPAYEAGILTGDKVYYIGGVSTKERSLPELVDKLKGPPGSEVVLKVRRKGWTEEKEFAITRRVIEVPSVTRQMLPGEIGLVKLTQFGEKSFSEFQDAVLGLENEGMKGLIVDLRNNPGGMLKAAIDIVDMFIGAEDRPIVTQKGRDNEDETEDAIRTYPNEGERPHYPLMVLVNQNSASASEIVSGALKDYNRAVVIGERTYGKGTVQTLFRLSPQAREILGGGDPRLRLTIKYYYLPSDRCIHEVKDSEGRIIHEGGVEPNIEIVQEKIEPCEMQAIEKIRYRDEITDYVSERYKDLKNLVLEGDNGELEKYPEFDEFYKVLDTTASKNNVRRLVRFHIRRKIEDELGRELAGDFQDDVQLQRAIFEVLDELDLDHPRYTRLRETFGTSETKERSDAKQ